MRLVQLILGRPRARLAVGGTELGAALSGPVTPVEIQTIAPARARRFRRAPGAALLALIVLLSGGATMAAMRNTSPTFDEITTMTGGARGLHTGDFSMMPDFPPLMQYLYGLPVYLSRPAYPAEVRQDTTPNRYAYAREFLYQVGNDPERIVFLGRLVAALCVVTLVLVTFAFTRHYYGAGAALMAASLVAFLPDVLAHGGVAYNDLPVALAFLAAVWSLDSALRDPAPARGLAAGALVSLAVGVKHSGLVLGPVALVLLALELGVRWQRRELRAALPRLGAMIALAVLAGYLVQVALYRGDFTLAHLRVSTQAAQGHIQGGHGVAAYLLGQFWREAPWYFYPVAFLYKTSVALHILLVIALFGASRRLRSTRWTELWSAPARAPIVALILFSAVLLQANLTIGFRYALPALPLICILVAAGVAHVWQASSRLLRAAMVALIVWSAVSALAYYPHFLAYTSEYEGDPDRGYSVFVDSSLDWGQGLLALRRFMQDEGIDRIYLSYFGSASPAGYGIKYVPLPSFFPLPEQKPAGEEPRFAAISATNLVGLYVGDVFARLRQSEPYRVLGHTMFVYRVR
jgi:hypothetical protein